MTDFSPIEPDEPEPLEPSPSEYFPGRREGSAPLEPELQLDSGGSGKLPPPPRPTAFDYPDDDDGPMPPDSTEPNPEPELQTEPFPERDKRKPSVGIAVKDPEPDGDDEERGHDFAGRSRERVELPCVFRPVDEISQYSSFRSGNQYPPPHQPFGIVVSLSGYLCYVETLKREFPARSHEECENAAWYFILHHQVAHFLIDRAVASLETTFNVMGRGLGNGVWQAFHQHHARSQQGFSTLEESLCCSYSVRNASQDVRLLADYLAKLQPPGYQRHSGKGMKILLGIGNRRSQSFQRATDHLLTSYLHGPRCNQVRTVLGLYGLVLCKGKPKDTNGEFTVLSPSTKKLIPLPVSLTR